MGHVLLRSEEEHVLAEVCQARERLGVVRRPDVDVQRSSSLVGGVIVDHEHLQLVRQFCIGGGTAKRRGWSKTIPPKLNKPACLCRQRMLAIYQVTTGWGWGDSEVIWRKGGGERLHDGT